MLLMIVIILLAGTFIDVSPAILLLTPIFLPMVIEVGAPHLTLYDVDDPASILFGVVIREMAVESLGYGDGAIFFFLKILQFLDLLNDVMGHQRLGR